MVLVWHMRVRMAVFIVPVTVAVRTLNRRPVQMKMMLIVMAVGVLVL